MAVLQEVFIGANRRFLAVALLDDRAVRSLGLGRRVSSIDGGRLYQKWSTIRHPLHGNADHGVDLDSPHGVGGCGHSVAPPELDSVSRGVGEGEFPTIGRPLGGA